MMMLTRGMLESKKSNCFSLVINFKLEDKTFHDVNLSLSSKGISQRLVMGWVENDFIYLILNNLSQIRV